MFCKKIRENVLLRNSRNRVSLRFHPQLVHATRVKFLYINFAVFDFLHDFNSSGVPQNIISPPFSPPSGPMSIT